MHQTLTALLERLAVGLLLFALAGCAPLNKALFQGLHPYAYGRQLMGQGRTAQAIEQLSRVEPRDPTFRDAQFQIGLALARGGDEEGALRHLLSLRAADPVAFDTQHWPGDRDSAWNAGTSGPLRVSTLAALYGKRVFVWSSEAERGINQLYNAGPHLLVRAEQRLAVLSKADRALRWEKNVATGSWAVPVYDASTVYVLPQRAPSAKPVFEALELTSGRVKWSRQLNWYFERMAPGLDEGTVYVGDGQPQHEGTLYALNKATGAVRWSAKVQGYPGPIAVSATHVCTQGSTRVLSCFNKRTGALTAKQDLPDFTDGEHFELDQARAYLSGKEATYAVNVNGGTSALAWKAPRLRSEKSSALALVGPVLISQTSLGLMARDPKTGLLVWQATAPAPSPSVPHVIPGQPQGSATTVLGWGGGWVYGVHPASGALQWALRLDERSPGIATNPVADPESTIYLATGKGLAAFKPVPWASLTAPDAALSARR